MESGTLERKLTAILSADVVGYSRLMGDDHEATVETLSDYRQVFVSGIEGHRGHVVDAKGDAILAEFVSVVDAVACAVEIQRELAGRNASMSQNRRMDFRIGVNLGDVLVKDDAIYGDGVNIAARLEALADPGGLCISRMVYDNVEGRLPLDFEYLGERSVKNIQRPVRVYRVLLEPREATAAPESGAAAPSKRRKKMLVAAAAAVLAAAGAAAVFVLSAGIPANVEQPAPWEARGLGIPDKPSIVVLPLVNMSGDPEQEYFSDGMTETLITDLSKLSNLFVIARNSAFTYKGRAVDVRQVSEELGVRYVLEGSIQKAGERVRINVQLVDAFTGDHLWAERYDRPFDDLFALQDEITLKIVTELDVQLIEGEQARMWRGLSKQVGGYETVMKGVEAFRKGTPEANEVAKRIFQDAIDADPDGAAAVAGLGWAYMNEFRFGWSNDPRQSMVRAIDSANRALDMDDTVAVAHSLLGFLRLFEGRHDESLVSMRKAISLQPNSSLFAAIHANALIYAGRPEESLVAIERAMRLSPFYPAWYLSVMSLAFYDAGRFEESIAANEEYLRRQQEGLRHLAYLIRALAYNGMGQEAEAREAAQEVLRRKPDFTLETLPRVFPYRDPTTIERMTSQLRDVGLN